MRTLDSQEKSGYRGKQNRQTLVTALSNFRAIITISWGGSRSVLLKMLCDHLEFCNPVAAQGTPDSDNYQPGRAKLSSENMGVIFVLQAFYVICLSALSGSRATKGFDRSDYELIFMFVEQGNKVERHRIALQKRGPREKIVVDRRQGELTFDA